MVQAARATSEDWDPRGSACTAVRVKQGVEYASGDVVQQQQWRGVSDVRLSRRDGKCTEQVGYMPGEEELFQLGGGRYGGSVHSDSFAAAPRDR